MLMKDSDQFGEDLAKVRTILRSSRAGSFRQLIEDYFGFVSAKEMISLKVLRRRLRNGTIPLIARGAKFRQDGTSLMCFLLAKRRA